MSVGWGMWTWVQVFLEARGGHQIPLELESQQLWDSQYSYWELNLVLCKRRKHLIAEHLPSPKVVFLTGCRAVFQKRTLFGVLSHASHTHNSQFPLFHTSSSCSSCSSCSRPFWGVQSRVFPVVLIAMFVLSRGVLQWGHLCTVLSVLTPNHTSVHVSAPRMHCCTFSMCLKFRSLSSLVLFLIWLLRALCNSTWAWGLAPPSNLFSSKLCWV